MMHSDLGGTKELKKYSYKWEVQLVQQCLIQLSKKVDQFWFVMWMILPSMVIVFSRTEHRKTKENI